MADIEWLLDEIEHSPDGPQVGAFFDFDGTLVAGLSVTESVVQGIKLDERELRSRAEDILRGTDSENHWPRIVELLSKGAAAAAGTAAAESDEEAAAVDRWARRVLARKAAGMVYPQARVLLQAHRNKGHTIVIASSAPRTHVRSAAEELGVENIVCTDVDVDANGVIVGPLSGEIRWGEGKAKGAVEFAGQHHLDLAQSWAYTNGIEDLPLLELVGNPRPLNADDQLVAAAKERGWPVGRLAVPPKPTPTNLVRSVAAFSAFGGGVMAGAAMAILNRDRTLGTNVAATVATELCLAIAGVNLNVIGAENLWKARPAVFIMNHQSQLDIMVLGALIRKNFTGVAKQSLAANPFFAPAGYLADVAYIDRANNAAAVAALAPVVDTLRSGKSIIIFPEGTRSRTERLLPFKKGPFHIAIQAGVPIVPIVLRNCGELMRPHSLIVQPGTIDVAVLPPIDTSTWNVGNLDEHIAAVRQQYLDTLRHWPTQQTPALPQ